MHFLTIKNLKNNNIDHFISLAPTSPLTEVKDINRSLEIIFQKKAKTLVSVVKNDKPIEWCLNKMKNNKITQFINKKLNNRQENKKLYIPNGSIYIFNYNYLKRNKKYLNDKTFCYVMPKLNLLILMMS